MAYPDTFERVTGAVEQMRLLHISDLHFWHIPRNPLRLAGKRLFGVGNLLLNRARKFRMGTMPALVARVREVQPDHVVITGDLTTTALEEEFQAADQALRALALEPASLTMIPGNHDRYTRRATNDRLFEKYFGRYAAHPAYPWLKWVGPDTAILALDACRPTRISARGTIGADQLEKAQALLDQAAPKIDRLLIACHYPVAVPAGVLDSHGHGLRGREHLRKFLARQAPHLYFHGHIHTPWSFTPDLLPRTICLNPGAALKRNSGLDENASMLEIVLQNDDVEIRRHFLRGTTWEVEVLVCSIAFFNHGS
jgi:3',5'-cyclic AMP phosphodiesterase CpdA